MAAFTAIQYDIIAKSGDTEIRLGVLNVDIPARLDGNTLVLDASKSDEQIRERFEHLVKP